MVIVGGIGLGMLLRGLLLVVGGVSRIMLIVLRLRMLLSHVHVHHHWWLLVGVLLKLLLSVVLVVRETMGLLLLNMVMVLLLLLVVLLHVLLVRLAKGRRHRHHIILGLNHTLVVIRSQGWRGR